MPIPGKSKNFRQISLRYGVKHNMSLIDLQLDFHAHDIIQRQNNAKNVTRESYIYNGGPIDSHKSYIWSVKRCHIQ